MKQKIKENIGGLIVLILIVVFLFWIFGSGDNSKELSSSSRHYYSGHYNDYEDKVIDRDEAIDYYWSDVRDYLSGTETIEACRISGNCYDLDADIYRGMIDTIYFYNGGYLNFDTEIDEDGYANEYDRNGDEWEFFLDMDLSLVDDAIEEWAEDNNYIIE